MVLPQFALDRLSSLAGQKVLVTGGSGFLGRHIVECLVSARCRVVVFDILIPPPSSQVTSVTYTKGDLLSPTDLSTAMEGVTTVFHVASPPPTSRNPSLFYSVNVTGTSNVLSVCRSVGCSKVVFTSSASVIFDGKDQRNLDETASPPVSGLDDYTKSKLEAERLVIAANGNGVWTCALRPHGIFGPRDPHMVPAMAKVGRSGKSRYYIGDGTNLVDFTYVENVAYAHCLAATYLEQGHSICGKEFFITNKHPVLFWDFFTQHFQRFGYQEPYLSMPLWLMRPMATAVEVYLSPIIKKFNPQFHPTFTRQAISYSGAAHYYSSDRAEKVFNYYPAISLHDGIDRTIQYFDKEMRNPNTAERGRREAERATRWQKPKSWAAQVNIPCCVLLCVAMFLTLLRSAIVSLFCFFLSPSFEFLFEVLVAFVVASLVMKSFQSTTFGEATRVFPINGEWRQYYQNRMKGTFTLITGANKGIGLSTAIEVAKLGGHVIIGCRDVEKGKVAVDSIRSHCRSSNQRVECYALDTSSYKSVNDFVDALPKGLKIHYLINNAGTMENSFVSTADGFDSLVQGNYLGHAKLTLTLLERGFLVNNNENDAHDHNIPSRVINVSSVMHYKGVINALDLTVREPKTMAKETGAQMKVQLYNNTKLYQILFSRLLQSYFDCQSHTDQSPRMTCLSLHPGAVYTEFIDHFIPTWMRTSLSPLFRVFTKMPEEAAMGILWAMVSREMDNVGGYYVDNQRIALPSDIARDDWAMVNVWEMTKAAIGMELPAK